MSPFYLRNRLPRLHPLQSIDDQIRGFVHAESRTIQNQIVILWIGRVLVEMVLDELVPFPVLGVHEVGGLHWAEIAFPGDERNSIVTGGHVPDTQGRFGRENERRAPADDQTFPTRAQYLEQADKAPE